MYNQCRQDAQAASSLAPEDQLPDIVLAAACVLVAYLIGSIPSGYLVARVRGVNIQQVGSGNIGVTNVLRSVGVVPAVLVGLADPLKGIIAVLLPRLFGLDPTVIAISGMVVTASVLQPDSAASITLSAAAR